MFQREHRELNLRFTMLGRHKGKPVATSGIDKPDNKRVLALTTISTSECFNVTQQSRKNKKWRGKIFGGWGKILKTKLNSRNLINGMNTWAASLIKYRGHFSAGHKRNSDQCIDRSGSSWACAKIHITKRTQIIYKKKGKWQRTHQQRKMRTNMQNEIG